mmetsp:Transcript_15473/g.22660  ORF Transcript_15473/g.22660 Transcript_15473/m.22660 type:complete len:258 (-) Transcript_15473:131-904(-)
MFHPSLSLGWRRRRWCANCLKFILCLHTLRSRCRHRGRGRSFLSWRVYKFGVQALEKIIEFPRLIYHLFVCRDNMIIRSAIVILGIHGIHGQSRGRRRRKRISCTTTTTSHSRPQLVLPTSMVHGILTNFLHLMGQNSFRLAPVIMQHLRSFHLLLFHLHSKFHHGRIVGLQVYIGPIAAQCVHRVHLFLLVLGSLLLLLLYPRFLGRGLGLFGELNLHRCGDVLFAEGFEFCCPCVSRSDWRGTSISCGCRTFHVW